MIISLDFVFDFVCLCKRSTSGSLHRSQTTTISTGVKESHCSTLIDFEMETLRSVGARHCTSQGEPPDQNRSRPSSILVVNIEPTIDDLLPAVARCRGTQSLTSSTLATIEDDHRAFARTR